MITLYAWATDRYDALLQLEQDLKTPLSVQGWVRCQKHPFPKHRILDGMKGYRLFKITVKAEPAEDV